MARDGIADITYVNPGYQPGRFPIIAIGQMPFMFGDARKGTAALDSWYRKYAATEMKDTHFCFAFIHDPGALHSTRKKIVLPQDLTRRESAPGAKHDRRTREPRSAARMSRPQPRKRAKFSSAASPTPSFSLGLALSVRHRQGGETPHRRAALHDRVHLLDEQGQIRIDEPGAKESHGRSLLDRLGGEDRRTLGRFRSRRPRQDESRSRSSRRLQAHPRADGRVAGDSQAAQGKLGDGGEAGRRRSGRGA